MEPTIEQEAYNAYVMARQAGEHTLETEEKLLVLAQAALAASANQGGYVQGAATAAVRRHEARLLLLRGGNPPRFRMQLYKGCLVTSWKKYSEFVTIQTAAPDGSQGEDGSLSREEFDALPWVTLQVINA